jgi:phosphoadenosine phosphosulfate reductase
MDQTKITHSKDVIRHAIDRYHGRIAVSCSWGKDSLVLLDLALQVDPTVPIFSLLTIFKPKNTYEFVPKVIAHYHIHPHIYMVADTIPPILKQHHVPIILLPADAYNKADVHSQKTTGHKLYHSNPQLCCDLLKVAAKDYAIKDMNLQAWFSGLRNTEGQTRLTATEIETVSPTETKINPLLVWTEQEIWQYITTYNLPIHPWYKKVYPDGRRIRSLGCEPCTVPVFDYESERDGRWRNTNKQAGECGLHQPHKDE